MPSQVWNVWSEAENVLDSEYSIVQLAVMNIQEIIPVVKSLINQIPSRTSSMQFKQFSSKNKNNNLKQF